MRFIGFILRQVRARLARAVWPPGAHFLLCAQQQQLRRLTATICQQSSTCSDSIVLKATMMMGSPLERVGGTEGVADIDMDMSLDFERENEGDEDDVGDDGGSDPMDSDDEDDVDEVPLQKFQVRQKVYARDDKASGVLYE